VLKINIIFNVVLFNESQKKVLFSKNIRSIIYDIVNEENKEFSYVNIIFCNDEFIRKQNKKYLGHDYETDILTFHDADKLGLIEGELLISVETVKSNSMKFKTNYNEEIFRVIIHGILHLCGFNDKTSSDKIKIRKKENYYLLKLCKCQNNLSCHSELVSKS